MKIRYHKQIRNGKEFILMVEKFHHQWKPTVFVDQCVFNLIWLGYALAVGVSWLTEQDKQLIARHTKKESPSL